MERKLAEDSKLIQQKAQEEGISIKDYCLKSIRKNSLGRIILNNIGENNAR
jgi:hypothetical protein